MIVTKTDELREFRNSGELSDMCISIDKTEFHLHKFPLFLNSEFFRALCRCGLMDKNVVTLKDCPGGAKTFSLIADYCYGLEIDINPTNVVELSCAAEYLQMTSLSSEVFSALIGILHSDPTSLVDILSTACRMGQIAKQSNIVSLCFEAVVSRMKKSKISENISEVLLELPVEWFVEFIVGARDAGLAVPKITRLAGRYIERKARQHKGCISKYLVRQNLDDSAARSDMMLLEDLAHIMDAIFLELPQSKSFSEVMDSELLCLLYILAVQEECKCEGMLLTAISNNFCKIPCEILVAMPTEVVVSIVEHCLHNNLVSPTVLGEATDRYLWERTKQNSITVEEFETIVRVIPTSSRPQHDSILLIAKELFSRTKIGEERKLRALELVDKYKIHEETLRHISEENVIPSSFIVNSALAVSSRLRNELTKAKAKLAEKSNEIREVQESISDVIQGQWKCNDATLNVTVTDPRNTRIQFAKVLARDTSNTLSMEHDVYDGKLTLCVRSRGTSTKSCETPMKTFLFDPFHEQLLEITRSKHDKLMVGEHYEKQKHTTSYWPFNDCTS